jgi:hypothetical protein
VTEKKRLKRRREKERERGFTLREKKRNANTTKKF